MVYKGAFMGLFDKFKKKKNVLQQDLSKTEDHPGMVFVIHLLMEEKCEMPKKEIMTGIMNKHLGETDCFCHDGKTAGFAPKKYKKIHFEKENTDIPPTLMITEALQIETPIMDEIAANQLWDCPEGSRILERCKYQVLATDMLASMLDYKDRAEMLVDYIEALVELYPSCKALVFENSKKCLQERQLKIVLCRKNPGLYIMLLMSDFLILKEPIIC